MAVSGAAIQILGGVLQYAIPLFGSPANKYIIPLEISAGQPVIFYFQDVPYQATITLSQEFGDYVFTPGGGARQIVIAAKGGGDINGQVTFIVPQSIRPYIISGEIVIEGQSADFMPSDADEHIASWIFNDPSSLTNGGFPVTSQGSATNQLVVNPAKGPVTVNGGVFEARDSSIDLSPTITFADGDNALIVVAIKNFVAGGNDPILLRSPNGATGVIRGNPFADRSWNWQGFYWNGQWANGAPVLHTDGDYLGGSGGIPVDTWTFFMVRGVGVNDTLAAITGGSLTGTGGRTCEVVDGAYVGVFQLKGVVATDNSLISQIQGYLAYFIDGLTQGAQSAQSFLDPTHPFYSSIPGSGAAGPVVVESPEVLMKLEGVFPGSAVLVERLSDGANLIDEQIAAGASVSEEVVSALVAAAPFDVRIVVRNASGSPRYKRYEQIDTFRADGLIHRVNQVVDILAP
ncbi:MAG: hypothetical protein AAFO83_01760 [Cyanobacteria bacterium J06607_13]